MKRHDGVSGILLSITFLAAFLSGGVTNIAIAVESPDEGTAYGWGRNAFGSLGDGTTTDRTEATQTRMPSGVNFSGLTTAYWHVCAIGSNSNTYCWGYNGLAGQLGDGSYTNRTSPTRVSTPIGVSLTHVSAGFGHTCGISTTGDGYCWGWNDYGQLGAGDETDRRTPVRVTMPTGITFTSIAAGYGHTCAVGSDGNAYCWGYNGSGQLGVGDTTDRTTPELVTMPSSVNFSSISAGHNHTCSLGSDLNTYCWGGNSSGQLGLGNTTSASTPQVVSTPPGVSFTSVEVGLSATCGITRDGDGYCWGNNYFGQLGVGNTSNRTSPTAVTMPDGVTFASIDPGYEHTCAVSSDLDAYCWGSNNYRELGDGTTVDRRTIPTLVIAPTGVSFASISPGRDLTVALSGPPAASPPDAPTGLEATALDSAAQVSFTPGNDGGSAITDYEYQLDAGAWASAGVTTSPLSITGLVNGNTYSIKIRAVNDAGEGAESASVSVTPESTPSAPTGLSATAQDQGASISFTPGSDGGSVITDYEYQLDGGMWQSANTASSPVVITGLTNGTTYSVKIRAVNGIGDGKGAASSAVNVTPVSSSDPPGAPTSVESIPGNGSLAVSWEAPSQGGAPITDYEYSTDGTTWISFSSTSTSATISNDSSGTPLVNGQEYTVRIRAKNTNGPGPGSTGVSQTPGIPLAPSGTTSAWNESALSLQWTPGSDNGDPISEYRVVVSPLSSRLGLLMKRTGPGTYTTTSTSTTIPGLDPSSGYTITLTGRNSRGWGIPTSFTVSGSGEVESQNQTPAAIIQQVGLPSSGKCEDVIDGLFGSQTLLHGGWGRSWAPWMNGGLGGAVCTRMMVYSNGQGRWVLAE